MVYKKSYSILEGVLFMRMTDIYALCVLVAFISFLGFAVENIWLAATKGYMDNRNMKLPFLLGYGIAILIIYAILGTPRKIWFLGKVIAINTKLAAILYYFTGSALCVSLGEILLGKFVEKVCHFYWWDYSKLPLHITRYTSVPTSSMFALMITLFMDKVFVPLLWYLKGCDPKLLKYAGVLLMVLLVGDFLGSAHQMYREKGMITRWRIDMSKSFLYRKVHVLFEETE